jgi:hypothetical protein
MNTTEMPDQEERQPDETDREAVLAMLAAVNRDEARFNAALGRSGVRFAGD